VPQRTGWHGRGGHRGYGYHHYRGRHYGYHRRHRY
jgi:hypothetical protein